MRVPFIDLARHHAPLRAAIVEKIVEVVDSQRFILGPGVAAFEADLAAYIGAEAAIGVSSGSDALLVALMALGVGPGDEVVVPSFTFFATAGAVARLGAKPVFADIDPESFNLAPADAVRRLTERTKAVIPVHLYGRVAELGELGPACRERGVAIVEDAAQAIGAADAAGVRAGALGDFGCFSFFPTKNLSAFGDGGAVTVCDAERAERVRVLRAHGSKPKYVHHVVGGNFRLDALQAAILSVKLPHLAAANERRQAIAKRYRALFADAGLLGDDSVVAPEDGPGRHVYHQFVVRAQRRDTLREFLGERGIDTMVYYPRPLHVQDCFAELGCKEGDLPESERASREVLALPVFPELSEDEQDYVVDAMAAFYRGE